jgi:hypothetical protein
MREEGGGRREAGGGRKEEGGGRRLGDCNLSPALDVRHFTGLE